MRSDEYGSSAPISIHFGPRTRSPRFESRAHPLIQEAYADDPWKVLVCCILLNRTHGSRQVEPLLPTLFALWPTAFGMREAGPGLEEAIRPLGLCRERATRLRLLAKQWCGRRLYDAPYGLRRADVLSLPGCGPYAADAYALVCLRDRTIEPEDRELLARLEHLLAEDEPDAPGD